MNRPALGSSSVFLLCGIGRLIIIRLRTNAACSKPASPIAAASAWVRRFRPASSVRVPPCVVAARGRRGHQDQPASPALRLALEWARASHFFAPPRPLRWSSSLCAGDWSLLSRHLAGQGSRLPDVAATLFSVSMSRSMPVFLSVQLATARSVLRARLIRNARTTFAGFSALPRTFPTTRETADRQLDAYQP